MQQKLPNVIIQEMVDAIVSHHSSASCNKTLTLTNTYAMSPIVCTVARRFGFLQVCISPGNDLLTDLLPVLVGPTLDKPQQAHDLPEVTAAATTELNISDNAGKPRRKGSLAIQLERGMF